jgi:tetratricopeptide (TPR) repeat protein
MNAAVVMQTCPNEETLAAFIDGRLDERARLEVIEHLADCGDCRDLVMTANEYEASLKAHGGAVVRGRFNGRWIAPLAAAAAVVAVLFGVPSTRQMILDRVWPKSGMEKLVEAANGLPQRTTDARLSGDFVWRDYRPLRGGGEGDTPAVDPLAAWKVDAAAAEITADDPHEHGVASILTKHADDAVKALETAARANPSSAEIQNDLAAAYIASGKYERALAAAQKSWSIKQSHAAAWNIALALDHGGRYAEAVVTWNNYLKLDPSSPWANEARQKLQSAQEMIDLQKK